VEVVFARLPTADPRPWLPRGRRSPGATKPTPRWPRTVVPRRIDHPVTGSRANCRLRSPQPA